VGQGHFRSVAILSLLRKTTRPLSLSAIAAELHIATSSAHAILSDLLELDAVTIDSDRRYSLGPRMFYIGSAFVSSSPVHRVAWPDVVELAHELGLSAAMATIWDNHHLILAVHDGPGRREARLIPGARIPLAGGSYGKVYYALPNAQLPDEELPKFGPNAVTDPKEFAQAIEVAKNQGYATDDEEFAAGVAAIACGVTSRDGYEGLIALWGVPADVRERVGFETAGRRLSDIADRASVMLGDTSRQRVLGVA
jgi:DNA-binding IclR family transcriptional regulator